MNPTKIKGLLWQQYFITKRSLEEVFDLFFYSILTVIVFGLFSTFLIGKVNGNASKYLLMGILLWEIVRVSQSSICSTTLWNVWARNLSNIFIAPLSLAEYLSSQMIGGLLKAIIVFFVNSLVALFIFHFNIYNLGLINLVLFFINLLIFSWSVGIIILGLIFKIGTRIQALAWGLVVVFQPLTAAFFPVSVLPEFLQKIAYLLPPTYVFESARANLTNPTTDWTMMGIAFVENIFYFSFSLVIFNMFFKNSKQTGQFARNEG